MSYPPKIVRKAETFRKLAGFPPTRVADLIEYVLDEAIEERKAIASLDVLGTMTAPKREEPD